MTQVRKKQIQPEMPNGFSLFSVLEKGHQCFCSFLCDFPFSKKIFLIYYFWPHWVFLAVCRLSLAVGSQGYSHLQSAGSRLSGFSGGSSQAQQPRLVGPRACGFQRLWRTGQLLYGTWNLRRPRIKPVSPALANGFLFTEPTGKLRIPFLLKAE